MSLTPTGESALSRKQSSGGQTSISGGDAGSNYTHVRKMYICKYVCLNVDIYVCVIICGFVSLRQFIDEPLSEKVKQIFENLC